MNIFIGKMVFAVQARNTKVKSTCVRYMRERKNKISGINNSRDFGNFENNYTVSIVFTEEFFRLIKNAPKRYSIIVAL